MPVKDRKDRALFILNPSAGVQPVNFIISKDLDRRKKDLKCLKTLNIKDTGDLIKENLDKHNVFIAAGGDGVSEPFATGGGGRVSDLALSLIFNRYCAIT